MDVPDATIDDALSLSLATQGASWDLVDLRWDRPELRLVDQPAETGVGGDRTEEPR